MAVEVNAGEGAHTLHLEQSIGKTIWQLVLKEKNMHIFAPVISPPGVFRNKDTST